MTREDAGMTGEDAGMTGGGRGSDERRTWKWRERREENAGMTGGGGKGIYGLGGTRSEESSGADDDRILTGPRKAAII